ncbi:MAG: SDR family oxidoreductase [Steroidobacteraceae bacterium]
MAIQDLFRLDGQVALITGGGGGLGSAIARAFAEAGADVAVIGRSRAPLDLVRADVERRGRRCTVIPGDVTDAARLAEYVDATVASLGRLSILINNVGGIAGDDAPKPAMQVSDDSWVAQVELNLTSVWRLTRAAVPRMRDGGVILNMSSIKAFDPIGGSAAYGAAKAGLNNLTVALAHELAPRFRVNGIAPGPVPTEKFKEVRGVTEADYPRVAREWGRAARAPRRPGRHRRDGTVPRLARRQLDHRPDADRRGWHVGRRRGSPPDDFEAAARDRCRRRPDRRRR